MAAETIRYRAIARHSYALALLALVELARDYAGPAFEWGPLMLGALELQGLSVDGEDLAAVIEVLAEVPGLVSMPDLGKRGTYS